MDQPLIIVNGLSKQYHLGEVTVNALSGVDISIQSGSFVVILGPSGSGKTTLLNLIGGIDIKSGGTIRINGKEITALKEKELTSFRKEDVGFIFQFYNLIPTLTAVENVELAARLKFSRREAYEKSLTILEAVEMGDKAQKFPPQLSGGEQQRVAIARALVKEPKIILADEPTGNLDSTTSEKILKVMMKICKEKGTTFLIVTHNVNISKLADHIIYLKDGQVFGTSEGLV
ncbi:MAG: ABC transporter ATP-binding protein [Candidatus Odinarchaeota archaeon]